MENYTRLPYISIFHTSAAKFPSLRIINKCLIGKFDLMNRWQRMQCSAIEKMQLCNNNITTHCD